jgi:chromosomal replication initiation ATPase DnaA
MALSELETRINGAAFAVWLRPAELIGIDPDGTLVVGARNSVQRERLERIYREQLVQALSAVVGKPVGIRFAIIGAEGEGALA